MGDSGDASVSVARVAVDSCSVNLSRGFSRGVLVLVLTSVVKQLSAEVALDADSLLLRGEDQGIAFPNLRRRESDS